MKISFINQKGGVGKSTAAMLVASALKSASCDVAIDDRDPQQSLTWWANDVGRISMINDHPNADIVITDTAGHLDLERDRVKSMVCKIIQESDRVILVSEMSPLSLQASVPMATLIKENLNSKNAKAYVLFNKVRTNTLIGKQNQKSLSNQLELKSLKNYIPLASAYEQISAFGWSSVTGKERKNIINLSLEILK